MSAQFKICFLKDNLIYKIYVFGTEKDYGNKNVYEIYKEDSSIFEKIFNQTEIDNIKKYDIKVYFTEQPIYGDDTI